jgi:hypothetical protein
MNRPLRPLAALAAALFWSGASIAQDGSPGRPPDGGMRGGGRLFISSAGEPFRGPDGLRRWFEGADADHDGVVTLAEFRSDAMRYFKVLDANGDGVIDGIENGVYENEIVPEITQMGGGESDRPQGGFGGGRGGGSHGGMGHGGGGMGRGGGGGGMGRGGGGEDASPRASRGGAGGARLEGASRFSLLDIPQPVRGADANLDWKVSTTEWAKAAGQRFALLDADGGGKLSLDTLPPLPGRGHSPGHGRRPADQGGRQEDSAHQQN